MEIVVVVPDERLRQLVREEIEALGLAGQWLTPAQASEYTGLAEGTLRNAVSDGRIKRHGEPGHALRFRRADLDLFLEGRRR